MPPRSQRRGCRPRQQLPGAGEAVGSRGHSKGHCAGHQHGRVKGTAASKCQGPPSPIAKVSELPAHPASTSTRAMPSAPPSRCPPVGQPSGPKGRSPQRGCCWRHMNARERPKGAGGYRFVGVGWAPPGPSHPPGPAGPGAGWHSGQGGTGNRRPLPSGPSCHTATLPPTQRTASARQATVPLVRLEVGGQRMDIPGRGPSVGSGRPERTSSPAQQQVRQGRQLRGCTRPLLSSSSSSSEPPKAPTGLPPGPLALAQLSPAVPEGPPARLFTPQGHRQILKEAARQGLWVGEPRTSARPAPPLPNPLH